jgi:hypothetical protein
MQISDETRKRYLVAGIVVGTVAVGLTVLAKRTPRDQWGSTLGRILKDVLGFVKGRYGNNEAIALAEKAIDRFQDGGTGEVA